MSAAAKVFDELRQKAPRKAGRAYREFNAPPGLSIRAFVDGLTRSPGISFATSRARIPKDLQFPRFRGASVHVVSGSDGLGGDVAYEIVPTESSTDEIFMELAARLIQTVAVEGTAEAGLLRLARSMAAWARFFGARGQEGLTRSEELGLIGELVYMGALASHIGFQAAVEAWKGPAGAPHDFQGAWGAVEVKLTTSSNPERFRITSERQLDETTVSQLFLFGIIAQEAQSAPTSLSGLVDQVRQRLDATAPSARQLFDESLSESGFADADRARYQIRLNVHQAALLRVENDFPRIRHDELRVGVFAVSYEIPWSSVAPFRVPENQVASLFNARKDEQ